MTIPKIEHVSGSRNTEYVILTCTGCNEYYSYSVRQYKGDFGCNITEFNQFLNWAMWEAAKHECFLAGRVGYIAEPPEKDPLDIDHGPPFAESEEDLLGGMFPERHEDPWGGVGYIVEPEPELDAAIAEVLAHTTEPVLEPLRNHVSRWLRGISVHEDPWGEQAMREAELDRIFADTPDDEDDDLDAWMDEELDLPPLPFACGIGDIVDTEPLDATKVLNFRRFYEMGPVEFHAVGDSPGVRAETNFFQQVLEDLQDEACMTHEECDMEPCIYAGEKLEYEPKFGVAQDESGLNPYGVTAANYAALQQAIDHEQETLSVRHPTIREIDRVHSFPPTHPRPFVIEIDYVGMEQRVVDSYLLDMGIYSLDVHGCLRDEKNRCLACLRPGPHLPFYWERE